MIRVCATPTTHYRIATSVLVRWHDLSGLFKVNKIILFWYQWKERMRLPISEQIVFCTVFNIIAS